MSSKNNAYASKTRPIYLLIGVTVVLTLFLGWTTLLSYTRQAFETHAVSRSERGGRGGRSFFVPHVGLIKRRVVQPEGLAQDGALEEGVGHKEELDLHHDDVRQRHPGDEAHLLEEGHNREGSATPRVATSSSPTYQETKKNIPALLLSTSSSSSSSWDPTKALVWKARGIYLPINKESKIAFLKHNDKQHQRWKTNMASAWNNFNVSSCFVEVPECLFFKEIDAKAMLRKCCVEHMKMKKSLFYTLDIAEEFGLRLFLDSGTLLSAMRDGGDTLLPWETDIDLGIVGVLPSIVAEPFKYARRRDDDARKKSRDAKTLLEDVLVADDSSEKRSLLQKAPPHDDDSEQVDDTTTSKSTTTTVTDSFQQHNKKRRSPFLQQFRRHLFETCKLKVSKNTSRNGMCTDAHYVYYADSVEGAAGDTSRVEIWPFWPEPGRLIHPTRKKLSVDSKMVLPLKFGGRCKMWGRPMWCPRDSEGYLDHEYTPDWRWPKTIHWGKSNAPAWKNDPENFEGQVTVAAA